MNRPRIGRRTRQQLVQNRELLAAMVERHPGAQWSPEAREAAEQALVTRNLMLAYILTGQQRQEPQGIA